jgi:hypothetical protein
MAVKLARMERELVELNRELDAREAAPAEPEREAQPA